MNFAVFFERTDPDELYHIRRPEVVTFALLPGVGYIYTYNMDIDNQYVQVNHRSLYDQMPGKLMGVRKLLVSNGLVKRNTYFYLLPGQSMETLLKRVRSIGAPSTENTPLSTLVFEGRVYKSQAAFWAPRRLFEKGNKGLFEHLCKDLNVSPEDLLYNFADVGDITYKQVYDASTKTSEEEEAETERLRQIHLNPQVKNQVIPKNTKAATAADKEGYKSIAQMRASKIVGDSVGL